MKYCHKCRTIWDGITQPGARETCLKCSCDLHVCLNCRFYDEHKPDKCTVDNADPVINKEKANYCEEFQFADRALDADSKNTVKARKDWNKLFKLK